MNTEVKTNHFNKTLIVVHNLIKDEISGVIPKHLIDIQIYTDEWKQYEFFKTIYCVTFTISFEGICYCKMYSAIRY